ncbi:hypothetical protein L596_017837 [Steinernema carpocapsae]|uniref:DUF7741 domain-containing protein n=1 Tax=Steinernema carpocapsae TaxID=34508 RepID=A0A4U5N2U0_STECR|nr:hypothetical protein L596_017837 [Steinernema carpocapsae]
MRRSTVFCLLLLSGLLVGEQICYICSGDSPLKGSFCNNDKVCTGTSCEITLRLSGAWFANCSSEAVDSKNPCVIDLVNTKASCKCGQSMCNSPQAIVKSIQDFLPPIFKNFTPEMPNLPIPCFECGDVVSSSKNLYTNCDEASICWGSFCYTKRGDNPHSYCGSSWDGNKDEGCFKTPAEDEVCVCKTPMCNVPYTKRTVIPKLISGSTVRPGRVPVMSTMKPEMMTSLGSVRPMTTTTAMGAIGTMRLASASGLVTTMKPGTTPLRPGSTTMKPGGATTPKRSTTTESIYEYYDYEYTGLFQMHFPQRSPLVSCSP